MNRDRIDELIALAALGELSPEDAAELDALVAADVEAAAELDDDLDTAAELQRALRAEPPPALRGDVLAAIARTPQDDAPTATGAPTAPTGPPAGAPVRGGRPPTPPEPVAFDASRRRDVLRNVLAAAAAVVLLVVGVIGVIVALDSTRSGDEVAAIIEADDASVRPLESATLGPLRVVYSPSAAGVVVQGEDVEGLDETLTYVLWLIDDSGAAAAGSFVPDADGIVATRIDGVDPTGFDLGVTVEPAAGSETPTPPVIATG